jgi:hypothetical protein
MSTTYQQPFLWYDAATLGPNGKQLLILLEELKVAYGFDYE